MSDNPYGSPPGGNPYGQNPYGTPQPQGYSAAPQSAPQPGGPDQPPRAGETRPAPTSLEGLGMPAAPAGELIQDTTTATFSADVIQESRNQPVLVDFWAPWCGPCKQLTPVLERVVTAAKGRVKLVKMNIDEHPSIAGQLQIQSIPAVFAFVDGQPVDGFMGALPESEVKAFIDRLPKAKAGAAGQADPVAEALEQAGEVLRAGNVAEAAQLYGAVLQHDPSHAAAAGGIAECYLASGQDEEARKIAEDFVAQYPDKGDDPAIAGVLTKFKLAEEIAELGDPASLQQRIESDPDDHQARYDLALIAQAKGDRQTAAGHLLEIIRRDRAFMDDGARAKLLEFFEAWGPTDPATKDARRKLSSVLFS